METASPPSYSSSDRSPGVAALAASTSRLAAWAGTSDAPPAYAFPSSFSIGSHSTAPFVSTRQLKNHLVLLHEFAELKSKVEAMGSAQGPTHMPSDKERRWTWFVGLAVERFEIWCKALEPSDAEKGYLPPIDVIMVWHAYLLNPGWYAEEVLTGREMNAAEYYHPKPYLRGLKKAAHMRSLKTSSPRLNHWVKLTSTPFDPFEAAMRLLDKEVTCPKCSVAVRASYMTDTGTGYLQQSFMIRCPRSICQFKITHDSLALRKLAEDLSTHRRLTEKQGFLAGTMHTPTNPVDVTRGWTIRAAMLKHEKLRRPNGKEPGTLISNEEYAEFIMKQASYHFGTLKSMLVVYMKGQGGRLIGRIASAYTDGRLFSVELVGATLRQGSFVAKMHDLQWTRPGFFDNPEDEIALQHAIARYHAFLDLMASSPASFFVPTLDIDLAWHTHQLMAPKYSDDTMKYVGRFIDHDDKVDESQLATCFDVTCRAWKGRYGVNYTHCGCPLPGDTIGQKLSRLVNIRSRSAESYLLPSGRADILAATHPSDHNAVFVLARKSAGQAAQQHRREKIAKRAEKDERRGPPHDPAFLTPVPLYESSSAAACAAPGGSVIQGAGAGSGRCAAVRALQCPVRTSFAYLGHREWVRVGPICALAYH
ncbi:hypothetical protein FB451DRAFT_1025893 [Mycena latifolia]|nr:hypothetical protein FB451DRAFT_1025893 [Mycena latifolia]